MISWRSSRGSEKKVVGISGVLIVISLYVLLRDKQRAESQSDLVLMIVTLKLILSVESDCLAIMITNCSEADRK